MFVMATPNKNQRDEPANADRIAFKMCKTCKHKFTSVDIVDGSWIDQVFEFSCPGCGIKLGTQTKWFECRPVDEFRKQLNRKKRK